MPAPTLAATKAPSTTTFPRTTVRCTELMLPDVTVRRRRAGRQLLDRCLNCTDTEHPGNIHTREIIIYSVGATVILGLWGTCMVGWLCRARAGTGSLQLSSPQARPAHSGSGH